MTTKKVTKKQQRSTGNAPRLLNVAGRYAFAGSYAYVFLKDPAAGRKHMYTTYAISLWGDKRAEIIGRELPLPLSRAVAKRHALRGGPV